MAKINKPLLSLSAIGTLGKHLVFRRRGKGIVAQQTARPVDRRSFAQLQWRTLYQKAVALWHLLSPPEKEAWERQATPRHMTGFAYFISQALKPNPGIYLPLSGGTMTGDIDLDGHALLNFLIDGSYLSQDFGASSLRLRVWNTTSKQGEAFRVDNAAPSAFTGKINGAPTSTSVVYDTDTKADCMKNLSVGAARWGRFILHNTTRGNSRNVVSWDVITKTIVTEDTTDDWADNDDITLQSQTCTSAGYMDVDLSDEITVNEPMANFQLEAVDKDNSYGPARRLIIHPYATYNIGNRFFCYIYVAKEKTAVFCWIPIIDQKVCVKFDAFQDVGLALSVKSTHEYADV